MLLYKQTLTMDAIHDILFWSKALKTKLRIAQKQVHTRFCLEPSPRGYITPSHFMKINWLPIERIEEQCTSTTAFRYTLF